MAKTKQRGPLLSIFLVVFIDLVGFGLVIPILPYYAQQFGANATQLGWLMACYSLMQFLFAPLWGSLSDIVGRRPVIVVSVLGTALSLIYLGFAHSLTALFVGRILAGICGANISTASAYIADVTSPEERTKGMGLIGASFGLGFIFGPALGGLLSVYGYGAPALAAGILALGNAAFVFWKLPEPILTVEQRKANRQKRFDLSAIQNALTRPNTRAIITVFYIVTFAFTQMECCFALFMKDRHGFDARHAGMLLAYMGVIMAFIQGGMIGTLSKRFGETALAMMGTTFMALSLVVFIMADHGASLWLALTLLALGQGLNSPSLMSLLSLHTPSQERGATMGVYQSAGSLARILGPLLAGFLYDHGGSASPFLASSFLMLGSSLLIGLWLVPTLKTAKS